MAFDRKQDEAASARTRHLIFYAHLLTCAPFLAIWMADPGVRPGLTGEAYLHSIAYILPALVYLAVRGMLALKNPRWLAWEYVFPPIDVLIISLLIGTGDRNPLGQTSLLYLFPVTEAAGTLSVGWSLAVDFMVLAGAAVASRGFQTQVPFEAAFRYFFILLVGSLSVFLARASSELRQRLSVAEDRNRIALEMHDGLQAHLVSMATQLQLADSLVEKNPARAREIVQANREMSRLTADELRFVVHRLKTPSQELGFVPSLRQFVFNLGQRNDLDIRFEVEGEPRAVAPELEHALFRIAQESLTNALKHSGASEILLTLSFQTRAIALQLNDNGKGFDPDAALALGRGLEHMRDRLKPFSGTVEFRSEEGKGSCVVAKVQA